MIDAFKRRKLSVYWTESESHKIFAQCGRMIASSSEIGMRNSIRLGMSVQWMTMGSANFTNLIQKFVAMATSLERSQNEEYIIKLSHTSIKLENLVKIVLGLSV